MRDFGDEACWLPGAWVSIVAGHGVPSLDYADFFQSRLLLPSLFSLLSLPLPLPLPFPLYPTLSNSLSLSLFSAFALMISVCVTLSRGPS